MGAAGTDDLALVLQLPASVGDLRTDIDFESSLNAQSGTLSVTSFEIPQDLSAGDTIELTFTVNNNQGGTPAAVTLTADFDPDANGQTLDAFARAVAQQVSNVQHPDTSLADRALGLSADIVTRYRIPPPVLRARWAYRYRRLKARTWVRSSCPSAKRLRSMRAPSHSRSPRRGWRSHRMRWRSASILSAWMSRLKVPVLRQ